MKLKHIVLIAIVAIFTISGLTPQISANSYLNGKSYASEATRAVKARKKVRVYKVTTGKYEAANRWKFYSYLHKGSKVKRSNWIMSTGGWIIKSPKKYHATKRTFYIITTKNWYYN